MTQEEAQELIDLQSKRSQDGETEKQASFKGLVGGWHKELKADEEFGGANYDRTVKLADAAMTKYGSPELRNIMNETGLGNNVHVVKAFAKMGKTISEDDILGDGKPSDGKGDDVKDPNRPLKNLYKNKSKKK